jgi:hypothetical protein
MSHTKYISIKEKCKKRLNSRIKAEVLTVLKERQKVRPQKKVSSSSFFRNVSPQNGIRVGETR